MIPSRLVIVVNAVPVELEVTTDNGSGCASVIAAAGCSEDDDSWRQEVALGVVFSWLIGSARRSARALACMHVLDCHDAMLAAGLRD
jgi:hypothetical protein